jgi:hypothetical protein
MENTYPHRGRLSTPLIRESPRLLFAETPLKKGKNPQKGEREGGNNTPPREAQAKDVTLCGK